VFKFVYGREPRAEERTLLATLIGGLDESDTKGAFRAIINAFDHQTHPTPFKVRFGPDDVAYAQFPGFELAVDQKDVSVSVPLLRGEYEPHLFKFFRETLRPGMVFVDVGANVGFYSMLAAAQVGETGRVFSFEPNPENCRLIKLSVARNRFETVAVFPTALGSQSGASVFSTHIGSNGGLMPDTEESLANPNCVVVPISKLEEVIRERIDIVKIDVEGAEGLVLQGAKTLIEEHKPIITSEFSLEMLARVSGMSGKAYLDYFSESGYRAYLCERGSGELREIVDHVAFVENYGPYTRIEDLVFMPGA
jgi:FkbM family methyltransferase